MNYKNLAIEFTETNYVTRSQIINYFGYSYNEEIWWEVCRYRKNFSEVLPLQCINNSNVFYVLYAKLAARLDKLSRDTMSLMVMFDETRFNKDFFYAYKNYFVKTVFKEILWLLKVHKINISLNTLILLVNAKKRPSNKEERFAKNLFMIFYRLVFSKTQNITIDSQSLMKIGAQLGSKSFLRTERWFLDIKRTLEAGFDPSVLPLRFKQLLTFIHKQSKHNALIKATAVFYYFKLGIMVNSNIDLIASFLFMYTLKISGLPQIVLTMPFLELIIKKSKMIDEAYYNAVESNNDITYLINIFIDIIELGIKEVKKEFENNPDLIKLFVKKNTHNNKYVSLHPLKPTQFDKSILEIKSLGLHNKEQLFLRTIMDATKTTYTLEDFQKITNASYEKARYSMNSFVKKGWFSRSKQGKKFIYSVNKDKLNSKVENR